MAKNPKYTPKQAEWLRKNVPGKLYKEIVPAFNKEFNENRTTAGLRNYCKQVLHINTGLNSNYKHPIGLVISNNKYNIIKIGPRKWQNYSHYVWEHYYNEKLKPNERIIHLDGNLLNDDISNLYKTTTAVQLGVVKAYNIKSGNPEIMKTAIITQELKQMIKEQNNGS